MDVIKQRRENDDVKTVRPEWIEVKVCARSVQRAVVLISVPASRLRLNTVSRSAR